MPPMPRGSLRCLRKKYSSHHFLKCGWWSAPKGASACLQVRMEMPRVLLEAVVGRQVHAAAEPPDGVAPGRDEEAHVHVHRRAVGIARMQHQRHAHRLAGAAGELRARGGGRGGRLAPCTCEKLTPPRSNSLPSSITRRDAAAALGARPRRRAERPAVEVLQRRDDARLQAGEVVVDATVRRVSTGLQRALPLAVAQRAMADVVAVLHAVEADAARPPRRRARCAILQRCRRAR